MLITAGLIPSRKAINICLNYRTSAFMPMTRTFSKT